ncbi:hypothetical protein BH18ACI2_BH18ACI2_20590 [soil metagenome]
MRCKQTCAARSCIASSWNGRKNRLFVTCTCPYYEMEGLCKHLWATLLIADKKGYLSAAANQSKLWLEMDDDALADSSEDEDEFDEDEFDEDEDELAAGGRMLGAVPATAPRRAQLPTTQARSAPTANSWKKRLAELSRSMQAHATQPVNAGPAERELVYLVDA